ncbi:transmembrane protein 80 isoform X1 [Lacerta agilis]|uniref:transmembrane protein 80 isoform X1 n=1 Tax=Lacerta agilis TaxID=80427 RepID=UPI001419836B|nr:transmembrane protein 80 isoform X1 [Lacerta agilis]
MLFSVKIERDHENNAEEAHFSYLSIALFWKVDSLCVVVGFIELKKNDRNQQLFVFVHFRCPSGIYKISKGRRGQVFTYPDDFLALDLILLFIMAVLEAIRLYFGTKGNLTEEEYPLGISLVITAGSIILSIYFLVWQTYVLRADVIINVVLLVTCGLEAILQVIAIAAFVS